MTSSISVLLSIVKQKVQKLPSQYEVFISNEGKSIVLFHGLPYSDKDEAARITKMYLTTRR